MRETIQKSKSNSGVIEIDEDAWHNPFVRDMYFGGELFHEVQQERATRRMKHA